MLALPIWLIRTRTYDLRVNYAYPKLRLIYTFLAACLPVSPPAMPVLRHFNDYPFYEYHYEGDYGFDAFLERGITRAPQETGATPFVCTVFAELGTVPKWR
jgi:hypothetical protein